MLFIYGRLLLANNLIACPCDEDAHQGADEIEEAVGQIGESGYAEDSGLGHAADIPRDEYGGHGDSILGSAAQQAALIAVAVVDVLEHVASEDDRYVLVCRSDIEEQA